MLKLYLSGHRFLCRHCSGLVYINVSKEPLERALRRAHTLRQRLGSTTVASTRAPRATYAYLLEKTLQAELQAYEAGTARIQWLAARIGNRRHKPQFTLD